MGNGAAVASKESRQIAAVDHETPATKNQNIGGLARLADAKSKFMNTKGRREALRVSKQIKGTNFIKELYHRLDPSITLPSAVDITGEIEIAIKYNREEKLLLLKVIKARELVPRDVIGYSDPYAVIRVIPDRYNEGNKKTKRKLRTLNPVFQEIFSFTLEEDDILETKVCVDVYDHDLVGSDDFMGQAVVDISSLNLLNELTYTEWFMLQQQTDFSVTGEVDVSLYHELGTLSVTIHKAKDLLFCDSNECSTYISIHVPFTNQSRSTKIVNSCLDPEYEETFQFDVSADDLLHRTIIMHIYRTTDGDEKHIGNVNVNLKRHSSGQLSRNWYRVVDMRNTARERTRLGESVVAQEFREAMFAHTLYHCPSFMFQDDKTGKKVCSVTCRQASLSSKMVLVNGAPLR